MIQGVPAFSDLLSRNLVLASRCVVRIRGLDVSAAFHCGWPGPDADVPDECRRTEGRRGPLVALCHDRFILQRIGRTLRGAPVLAHPVILWCTRLPPKPPPTHSAPPGSLGHRRGQYAKMAKSQANVLYRHIR